MINKIHHIKPKVVVAFDQNKQTRYVFESDYLNEYKGDIFVAYKATLLSYNPNSWNVFNQQENSFSYNHTLDKYPLSCNSEGIQFTDTTNTLFNGFEHNQYKIRFFNKD